MKKEKTSIDRDLRDVKDVGQKFAIRRDQTFLSERHVDDHRRQETSLDGRICDRRDERRVYLFRTRKTFEF